MKKIVLPCFVVAMGLGSNAQTTIFEETFDSSIPGTWTIIDVDGLASSTAQAPWKQWAWFDYGYKCAASSSWYSPTPGASDDWLITPSISIPASGNYSLLFDAASYESGSGTLLEDYEVLMSTTGTATTDFTTTLLSVTNENYYGSDGWTEHYVALPAAALGANIYIAFRSISDQKSLVLLDNVAILDVPNDDMGVTALTNENFVQAGSVTITGQVKNYGANPISSFDLNWNDGTDHVATITASIPSWGTYDFSHSIPLSAAAGTLYNIDVCTQLSGDADATNDCQSTFISTVTSLVDKNVVGEERTGTWCGWCPRGAVAMEGMESEPHFIGIAVHNGSSDPMTVSSYDSGINAYIPPSFPGSAVDRVIEDDPSNLPSMFAMRSDKVPPATITVEAVQSGSSIDVTVTADFVGPIDGDYRLAAVITEDNVTGTTSGYDQHNYYSGYAALSGAGHDWYTEPDPVPAADMEYDHVARALGDNMVNGASGSLPSTVAAGASESHTYTFSVSSAWDLSNCHFIGMLIDNATGEILNGGTTSTYTGNVGVEENASNFGLEIFPNPSKDVTNVRIDLEEQSTVSVVIYTISGEVVYSNTQAEFSAGTYTLPIDISGFAPGVYTVKTVVNGTANVTKLSVQ